MDLWIPITFAAAFLQNLRTALQKRASEKASTLAATMTRYLFTFATSHFVFREKPRRVNTTVSPWSSAVC